MKAQAATARAGRKDSPKDIPIAVHPPGPIPGRSKLSPRRKPGPARKKGATKLEQDVESLESQTRASRRRVSGKDRAFIARFVEQGYKEPEQAAMAVGFRETGIGWKLVERLRHLIDAERSRSIMGEQMELSEALILLADLARKAERDVDRHGALRTVLQVHGALSDKPLPTTDRRTLSKQVSEIIDRVQRAAASKPGTRVRVRAMLGEAVEVEAQAPQALSPTAPASSDDAIVEALTEPNT